tara:strand:+ start:532 stop:762 length:231 start_codon:yes stop_codon:yes gene_type:complete
MKDWDPTVVRGHHILQLLNDVSDKTLKLIREDLGGMTFANCDVIRIVERVISNRKRKETLEQFDTVSVEEPDFWDS